MERIEPELDEPTLTRARRYAEAHRCSLEQLLTRLVEQLEGPTAIGDPLLGLWRQETEVVSELIEEIMTARENHPLRYGDG